MQCRKLTESQLGLKDEQVSQLRQLAVNQLAQKDEEVEFDLVFIFRAIRRQKPWFTNDLEAYYCFVSTKGGG